MRGLCPRFLLPFYPLPFPLGRTIGWFANGVDPAASKRPAGRGGRRRLAGPWPAKPTPTGGRRPPVGVVRAARARRPPRSAGRRTCPWAVQPPAYRPSLAIGASRFGSGGKQYRSHAYLPQSNTLRAASKPKGIKTLRGSRSPGRSLAYAPSFLLGLAGWGGAAAFGRPLACQTNAHRGPSAPGGRCARCARPPPPRPAGRYFLPKGE